MITTQLKPNSCSCNKCKNMCKTCPCLGTPEDIYKLVVSGYGNRLSRTTYVTGMIMGAIDRPISMVQPLFDEEKNQCTFLNSDGLCELHDLGLKPTEGKLVSCTPEVVSDFKETINFKVASTWLDI